jgi:hypothetical protein
MSIISTSLQTLRLQGGECPTWCAAHLPTGTAAVTHVSIDRPVTNTAGGPAEQGRVYVSIDQLSDPGHAAAIRLDGGKNPMTPQEALQLAGVLQTAALEALGGDQVDECTWARLLLEQPALAVATMYRLDVEHAVRIQEIVADLLSQVEATR